jgi:O-methyltransferase
LTYLSVPIERVRENFRRMNILHNENVIFLKGFFNVTMKQADKTYGKLSILRVDGDMYESCVHILIYLYDHLSIGGYVIIDDYHGFPCREAVDTFRSYVNIRETIVPID